MDSPRPGNSVIQHGPTPETAPETSGTHSDPELRPASNSSSPSLANSPSQEAENDAALPTSNDLTLQGHHLPELHLDIHVYAQRAADRFVFINMRQYREGGQTPEGVIVERITRDGAVLNHHGLRFFLPRQ
jgi:hypothetical protein